MTRRRAASATALRALVVVLALAILLPLQPTQAKEAHDGLRILGTLPVSTENPSGVVSIDNHRRRMYYISYNAGYLYLEQFDLRPAVPRLLHHVRLAAYGPEPGQLYVNYVSPNSFTLDTRRNRLLFLSGNLPASQIVVIDPSTGRLKESIDVPSILPGFEPTGMTYSREDDRLYLVGTVPGSSIASSVDSQSGAVPTALATVIALSARDYQRQWVRPVTQCQKPFNTYSLGTLIVRAASRPVLYFACARTSPYVDVTPGESGIARIFIGPKASQQDAQDFRTEFFPISGSYTKDAAGVRGSVAYDPKTERLFINSQSLSTPGSWVFDGRLGAWVGFIASPNNQNSVLGINPGIGHLYIGSFQPGADYLLVADGRATPVPQGRVFGSLQLDYGFTVADPGSRRLFAKTDDLSSFGLGQEGQPGLVVLRDLTPRALPLEPTAYDAQTSDVPEGPKTVITFSGDVDGFGARLQSVGGFASGTEVQTTGLTPGDRGLMASRVTSLDLREVGASAAAQAFSPDNATDADRRNNQNAAREHSEELANEMNWPWAPASCLDSGSGVDPVRESGAGGEAGVSCSLSTQTAHAEASTGAVSSDALSIGGSSFSTKAWKDSERGVITETRAVARGFELAVPGAGSLSISKVIATATTSAHGRPRSTSATWERLLDRVVIRDPSGRVVDSFGHCTTQIVERAGRKPPKPEDSCQGVEQAISEQFGARVRIDLPLPAVTATPKGAFAAVEQTDSDYYQGQTVYGQGTAFPQEGLGQRAVPALQIVVFNDGGEKSRYLVQLAAIQASSIYTVSPLPSYATDTQGSRAQVPAEVATEPARGPQGAPSTRVAAIPVDLAAPARVAQAARGGAGGTLAFLVRSPMQAVSMAGVMLLFAAAVVAVRRRRALLGVLAGKGKVK